MEEQRVSKDTRGGASDGIPHPGSSMSYESAGARQLLGRRAAMEPRSPVADDQHGHSIKWDGEVVDELEGAGPRHGEGTEQQQGRGTCASQYNAPAGGPIYLLSGNGGAGVSGLVAPFFVG